MRVAYLIQTHTMLAQIERLVRTIRRGSPSSFILISHHTGSFRIPPVAFEDLGDIHVLEVDHAYRGDFSLVSPYLDGIAWLLDNGIDFDWLVNISGQCYPLQPIAAFETALRQSDFDGHMYYFDAFSAGPENIWGLSEADHRYRFQYRRLRRRPLPKLVRQALSIPRRILNGTQPWIRLETGYGLMVGWRPGTDIFDDDFRCYGGSQFKSLSRSCAEYLLEFGERHPEVVEYFRRTVVPDETYVQTAIVNNRKFRINERNMFYVDWEGGRLGHPRTLTAKDYPKLVSSGAYFGRKFNLLDAPEVLDMLDRELEPAA